MKPINQRHGWILIAAIAIVFALLQMPVPQGQSGNSAVWVAILPLLFAGIISPLGLLGPLALVFVGRTPDAPVQPASFQRTLPFSRA